MISLPRSSARTGGIGDEEAADVRRRLANLIRLGRVAEVQYDPPRIRVRIGDPSDPRGHLLTNWLPWSAQASGSRREWNPPAVGEPVTLLAPGGELAGATVLPGTFSEEHPPPADRGGLHRVVYADGTEVEYDLEAHAMTIRGGVQRVTLEVGAEVSIKAPTVRIEGDVVVTGGDVTADGISLKQHVHTRVERGNDVTGEPQG
jgi:phage baseplate assembly protein V